MKQLLVSIVNRHVVRRIFVGGGGQIFFVCSGYCLVCNAVNIVLFAFRSCSMKKIRVCLLFTTSKAFHDRS